MIISQKFINYFNKSIIFLLLLLWFQLLIFKSKKQNIICNQGPVIDPVINPVINNYKLYNESENPLLTLIFNFSKVKIGNDSLTNFLKDLSSTTIKDAQILILFDSHNNNLNNKKINLFFKEKRIETFIVGPIDWMKNFLSLVNLIKGKFFILNNIIEKIENNIFDKVSNLTKGSIKNIFEIKNDNNNDNNITQYLIRTKAIKDIMDLEIEFHDFKDIINYINLWPIKKMNFINIAFCPDNYYSYLTYVSMISILSSKDCYTYIFFYLVIPLDFSSEKIKLIERLYEQFEYFNITFIKIDNRYKNAYTNRYLTKSAFYRMSLGELLPNLNKILIKIYFSYNLNI